MPALQPFATCLSSDCDAVSAGVTLAWSNGQIEGQVNRLKTLRRQMYGSASLDLLERRFLLAARSPSVALLANLPQRLGAGTRGRGAG